MTLGRRDEYLASLVQELRKLSEENEWVEFKVNAQDPEEIGEYVSALANSAAMVGKAVAYLSLGHFGPRTRGRGHELQTTGREGRQRRA